MRAICLVALILVAPCVRAQDAVFVNGAGGVATRVESRRQSAGEIAQAEQDKRDFAAEEARRSDARNAVRQQVEVCMLAWQSVSTNGFSTVAQRKQIEAIRSAGTNTVNIMRRMLGDQ